MIGENLPAEPPISARTGSGAAWLISSRFATRGVDLATLAILARLLDPAAFGLVAIAMTLLLIVEAVFELPILQALVRIEILENGHFDTAFTLGVIRGGVLALVMALCAWPFALIYGDHRLAPLICVLAFAPAMRGVISPRMAIFARQINFRRDFVIEIVGKVAALIAAATVAFTTHSYWAIVAGTVATPTITAAASFGFAPYRPRLSLSHWPAFRSFLGWSSAAQVLSAISWQCDRLLLGHFTTPAGLGRYALASDLAAFPETALVVPVGRPLMAAFALIRNDDTRLRLAYLKASRTIVLLGLPLCLGLSLLADPVVRLLLGGKWLAAIPLLRWLALASVPMLAVAPFAGLAMAEGRTEILFRQKVIEAAFKIPAIALAAMTFGVAGVIAVRIGTSVMLAFVTMALVRRISGVTVARQLTGVARPFASGGAMALTLALVTPRLAAIQSPVLLGAALAATVALGALVYAGSGIVLWQLAGRPDCLEAQIIGRLRRMSRRLRRKGPHFQT
ncbi:lipopolysaccharide biosynthesis protein [Polymorphobacter sp. PAMC 29334]|uniref:lipopolysaccharide biosynthesis protein n=1 Tax=Polymorphobacter sp. PAMC 29334 TaxID=2862331 RepID=UPI001C67151C|nr:lipopolysaccharide biosynthesis protein [Polymorphobacter sp. PAMC 29334]QYE35057.1 lipopolysaccharide biosynthesis protein [Polymorphobacter sp. PAMC 29334]